MSCPKFTALRCLVFITSALPFGIVTAQLDNDSVDNSLEIITVVGGATNALITTEDLETYQATDLADIFRLTPSISVGGSVGIAQKIYVRGLEDSLINVTVDGAPQTSTLFHHIGRVTIDPSLLEQVEVQAGAGEATSGAGALGGAIRFKTKDADDLLELDQSFGGNIKFSSFSNDGTQQSASLYGRLSESWGVLAYFNDISRDNFDDGDGNEVFGTSADQKLGFLKLSGHLSENQSLSLSYEKRDEEGQFSARPNWVVQADDLLYDSEALRDTAVINYHLNASDTLNLEATLYQTESSFLGGRFDYLTEIDTVGFDLRNTSLAGDHRFVYGVDYRDDRIDSGDAEDPHAEEGSILGIYAQGYSQVSDTFLLSYGLRYDKYDFEQLILRPDITTTPGVFDSSDVSFNAGFDYDITSNLSFGLGYAEASRGKEIGDGFTLESYLFNRAGEPQLLADDLQAEQASNIEASLNYATSNFNAKLALYSSDVENAIEGGVQFENIGTIESEGYELSINYQWNDFQISSGFSSTDSVLDPVDGFLFNNFSADLNSYEFNGLGNSRGDTWNLGVNYTPTSELSFGVNASHVTGLTIDTLYRDIVRFGNDATFALNKPSYTTVDIFAEWAITDNLVVNMAATNLFDEFYRDHSSVGDYSEVPGYEIVVGPWEAGRDIRLSVSYDF